MKYPGAKLKFCCGDAEIFGANYVGSNIARKNSLKRKIANKNK